MPTYRDSSGNVLIPRTLRNGFTLPNPIQFGPTPVVGVWASDTAMSVANNTSTTWREFVNGTTMDDLNGAANRPLYIQSSANLNSRACLRFNRTTSQNITTASFTNINQPFYSVLIASFTGPTSTTEIALGTGGGGASGVGKSGSLNQWFIGNNTVVQSGIAYSAAPILLIGVYNGSSSRVVAKTTNGTLGNAGAMVASVFSVGGSNNGLTISSPATCDVHYAALFSSDPRSDPKWPVILGLGRDCGVTGI